MITTFISRWATTCILLSAMTVSCRSRQQSKSETEGIAISNSAGRYDLMWIYFNESRQAACFYRAKNTDWQSQSGSDSPNQIFLQHAVPERASYRSISGIYNTLDKAPMDSGARAIIQQWIEGDRKAQRRLQNTINIVQTISAPGNAEANNALVLGNILQVLEKTPPLEAECPSTEIVQKELAGPRIVKLRDLKEFSSCVDALYYDQDQFCNYPSRLESWVRVSADHQFVLGSEYVGAAENDFLLCKNGLKMNIQGLYGKRYKEVLGTPNTKYDYVATDVRWDEGSGNSPECEHPVMVWGPQRQKSSGIPD